MRTFASAPDVRLVATEGGEGAILVDLLTDDYYALNRTALAIWNVVSIGGAVTQAADALTRAFDVSGEQALSCVKDFVQQMMNFSLLVLVEQAEG